MPEKNPVEQYSPDPNLLERKAAEYLERQRESDAREPHPKETVRRVLRWAVIWAAVAGILSGSVIGGSELLLQEWAPGELDDLDWQQQAIYWGVFLLFGGIVSTVEILFIYWNSLRAIARVREIASKSVESHYSRLTTLGLARAALEFPNPRVVMYGIDPYARMSNWRLTVQSLLYRMKVGVSTFATRILVRRVFSRAAIRGMVPLLAGPLYAIWNAIITWRVVREGEIRAFGPAAVEEVISRMDAQRDSLSSEAVELVFQGVGELILRGYDAHPNYVLLLTRLVENWDIEGDRIDVDWERHHEQLPELGEDERQVVLDVLTVATLLGSKVRKPQKEFLRELYADCQLTVEEDSLDRLRTRLMDGESVTEEDLRTVRS